MWMSFMSGSIPHNKDVMTKLLWWTCINNGTNQGTSCSFLVTENFNQQVAIYDRPHIYPSYTNHSSLHGVCFKVLFTPNFQGFDD